VRREHTVARFGATNMCCVEDLESGKRGRERGGACCERSAGLNQPLAVPAARAECQSTASIASRSSGDRTAADELLHSDVALYQAKGREETPSALHPAMQGHRCALALARRSRAAERQELECSISPR